MVEPLIFENLWKFRKTSAQLVFRERADPRARYLEN